MNIYTKILIFFSEKYTTGELYVSPQTTYTTFLLTRSFKKLIIDFIVRSFIKWDYQIKINLIRITYLRNRTEKHIEISITTIRQFNYALKWYTSQWTTCHFSDERTLSPRQYLLHTDSDRCFILTPMTVCYRISSNLTVGRKKRGMMSEVTRGWGNGARR